jgi:hypothetical protein
MTITKKFAIAMAILTLALLGLAVFPVLAYQGNIGGSPYASALLVSGVNTGRLDPGQEYWYAYSRMDLGDPATNSIILSLNFEADGAAVANRINFQVFTFDQVESWLADNSSPVDSMGLGISASADFDAGTGERMWAGPVAPTEVYYVRIFNLSPSPVQFRLTALGQKNNNPDGFMSFDSSAAAAGQESMAIPASVNVPGSSPAVPINAAMPIAPNSKPAISAALPVNVNDGSLASTGWLLAAQAINGQPPQEAAAWLMSAAMLGWLPTSGGNSASVVVAPANAPAVAPAVVPVNPNPASAKAVVEPAGGDEPEIVAQPAALPVPIDPEPDALSGQSIYPNRPLRLLYAPNTGRMAPKTEHWYTFTPGKVDGKLVENYSLTMFFTPGEPNLARDVTFEMFTGDQFPIWSRGTPGDMVHFGAGSWISRDNDYDTGERLWHGTVVDGDQYYVKLTNATGKWIDYHLVPGDIVNLEMGDPDGSKARAIKAAPQAPLIPTGKDIGVPLLATKGSNAGKLPAGSERWFSFTTPNTTGAGYEFKPYLMELTHKPGFGAVANYINVEIYPYQEQALWRRGDGDQMTPLGAGSYTEYDQASDSHTWVWDGHLVSNTTYFIKVRNGSAQEVDYDLVIRPR